VCFSCRERALETINQGIEDEILISVGLAGPDVDPLQKEVCQLLNLIWAP
jgi:hypothetical protein